MGREYPEYLRQQGIPMEAMEKQTAVIGEFIGFLEDCGVKDARAAGGMEEAGRFARKLIAEGRNTLESFETLRDYAAWIGNRPLYVAFIEVMDCHNALAVLADVIEDRHGRSARGGIFIEALPPLGADEKERCAYTRGITEHMAHRLTPKESRDAWFGVKHGIPADAWLANDAADREKRRLCGSTDGFLDLKRRERDALLTRLRDEGKLWYTVLINDEVLEFVRNDPEMEVGRREGSSIYITKIPYNAARYLHETDGKMKRYYACHCPLVREAILDDRPISPEVCHCSLGHAGHYLAGLDLKLEGEVLESAIKGDVRCRFVFHMPDLESPP